MADIGIFLGGFALTLLLALAALAYLRSRLHRTLLEASTEKRAAFWSGFVLVMLLLLPSICSLAYAMEFEGPFFDLVTMLNWGLIGLAGWLFLVGAAVLASRPRAADLPVEGSAGDSS